MERNEMQAKISQLLEFATPETQAQVSAILSELSDGIDAIYTASENHATQNARLVADNETLRNVNTRLFLKVGEVPKADPNTPQPSDPNQPEFDPSLTYENLFNEKGELK